MTSVQDKGILFCAAYNRMSESLLNFMKFW